MAIPARLIVGFDFCVSSVSSAPETISSAGLHKWRKVSHRKQCTKGCSYVVWIVARDDEGKAITVLWSMVRVVTRQHHRCRCFAPPYPTERKILTGVDLQALAGFQECRSWSGTCLSAMASTPVAFLCITSTLKLQYFGSGFKEMLCSISAEPAFSCLNSSRSVLRAFQKTGFCFVMNA